MLLVLPLTFYSNVFAALTLMLDMCFELFFAVCNTDFHESVFENIMLFVTLIAETALSATLLTNLMYALTTESGEFRLFTTTLQPIIV